LIEAGAAAGARIVHERVGAIEIDGDRTTGVRLGNGDRTAAGAVVIAAGYQCSSLGLPAAASPPVRPVKGQILRLRAHAAALAPSRTLRGIARGQSVYVVPRADGEIVVGATVEELGSDTRVVAGAVHDLLRAAIAIVPGIAELELVESSAGLRPGTPDNAPILGPTSIDGLILATGHYRNGILLTPITSDAITALLIDGQLPPLAAPFTLARFAP
jgi:glycine oxidase